MDARNRQVWERQRRDWEMEQDASRFEELDDDDEGAAGEYWPHEDLAYGEDYDELSQEYEYGNETQRILRRKEDELAERALRRIRRARMKGESSVDLSREELDALEKRRYRQGMVRTSIVGPAAPAAIEAPPSRPTSSRAAPGAKGKGKASPKASAGSKTNKTAKTSKGSKAGASSPISEDEPEALSPGDMQRPAYWARAPGGSPVISRTNSRNAMRSPPTTYEYMNRPGSSGSLRRRGDVSPTRSLPDDPDWMPTSRSRSSSQVYRAHNSSPVQPDAMFYQVGGGGGSGGGRRIVSDPMHAVSYSNLRRNPPTSGRSMLAHEIEEAEQYEDEGGYYEYDDDGEAQARFTSAAEAREPLARQRYQTGTGGMGTARAWRGR